MSINLKRIAAAASMGYLVALTGLTDAHADPTYPERPVRVIVPFAAGGGADIVARLVFQGVAQKLGQSFIIDNRGGAGGIIGTDAVAKAPADGYTVLLGQSGPNAINPSVYKTLPYDAANDFTPVTQLTRYPYVIAVRKNLPANTLEQLIEHAKLNPGRLSLSTAGHGSSSHLAVELFKRQAGIDVVAVPYKGAGPALLDVVGGNVDMTFGDAASASKQASAGTIKALAVTGAKRSPLIPDVPTAQEAGVAGFEASAWHAVLVPRNTPDAIIEKLYRTIAEVLSDPALKARLAQDGIEVVGSSPTEFRTALLQEIDKWRQVVDQAKITLD